MVHVAEVEPEQLSSAEARGTSRCLQLGLDDSLEQTRRIQAAQAREWAGARTCPAAPEVWQDAQRLLAEEAPAQVVIPFAPRLAFPARTSADRRGSARLLGLVAAHTLLHARQRDRDRLGRLVALVKDYAAVHALLRARVEESREGLSPRAARLHGWLVTSSAGRATRREIALALGWGYNTAKRALEELLAQELCALADKGPPAAYRLLERALPGSGAELVDPASLG